ncbi:UNVERIFIED_CONTAM: hypothetical protein RMT77_019707 [Armadillidium vulgare]
MFKETMTGCLNLCQKNPKCLLACKLGRTCRLYAANVASHYSGTTESSPQLSNHSCLSFWSEAKDIANKASFTSSRNHKMHLSIKNIDIGFGCPRVNTDSYGSNKLNKPWVKADLRELRNIKKVVVQTRDVTEDSNKFPTNFTNVEVRVGNDSGNFASNLLLMHFKGTAAPGEIVSFEGENTITGQFISIQTINNNAVLIFHELKIVID